ncbi:hypothetical protein JOF29_005164 [Kribbella aluminosa]|uniref:Uncharacterized protein n=1 Tax=Kribbella aluminosa TaxID=416017 RepID=A0ABS4UR61_9ACTN|nr:hypothetical protein [Kribbella aluminosa]MBP2354054.1 hypothetical protein [Kribbella aluminosa]
MRRQVRRLFDRHSPWRRGYDEGFDGGIWIAAAYVDRLLSMRCGSMITRDDVRELAAEIRRELA